MTALRPVLAIDIDGVLNALGTSNPQPGWGDLFAVRSEGAEPPRVFRLRINQKLGPALMTIANETGAELVWCTRWWWMANYLMSPLMGFPELPCVPMRPSKWEALAAWADKRPVCWLDDEPEPADGYEGAAKVIPVNGSTGLTDGDLDEAREWLASLREPEMAEA